MKHALVHLGNEESYGLLFVGGELKEHGEEIRFFDAEMNPNVHEDIIAYHPDFVEFSPMTTFFSQAYKIASLVKAGLPNVLSVFGGHHAMADTSIIQLPNVDIVVKGPVRGAVKRILTRERGVIQSCPTNPEDLPMPAREEYYRDIPRMKIRYRKVLLSMLGCPWGCSYCSSSARHVIERFGHEAHKIYYLGRRSIQSVMKEAKEMLKFSEGQTQEIEWVDDDMFTGENNDAWVSEFSNTWHKEIGLPMYISTTSMYALKVSEQALKDMRKIVNCIGMGVQAIRPESLRLFHRQWDNEERMKKAYDRLVSFGYRVNLQGIVGLPVDDPVEDALATVEGMKRIGPGSICSVYPLQIYPGTEIKKIVEEKGMELNDCSGDTNSGDAGIKFDPLTTKRLKNLCKFATLYVKGTMDKWWEAAFKNGNIPIPEKFDSQWFREILDIDYDSNTSQMLSLARYHDCVVDRLNEKGDAIFADILKGIHLRF